MIITGVERVPKARGRVLIHLDDVSSIEVGRETALASDLTAGSAIEAEEIDAIVATDRARVALDAAVAMIARRPCSEREVRLRLLRRRCEAAAIDDVVRKLRSARLLDDAEYARARAEHRDRSSPRGRRLIVQELRRNGVALEVARVAADDVSEEDAARRAAERRMRGLADLDYEAFRHKLGAFLQRRGFGWEICSATVDACWRAVHGGQA